MQQLNALSDLLFKWISTIYKRKKIEIAKVKNKISKQTTNNRFSVLRCCCYETFLIVRLKVKHVVAAIINLNIVKLDNRDKKSIENKMYLRIVFLVLLCVSSFMAVFGQLAQMGISNDSPAAIYDAFEAPRLIIFRKSKDLSRYDFVRRPRFTKRLKQIKFEEWRFGFKFLWNKKFKFLE